MRVRNTLLALLLFTGLGLFIYYYEFRGEAAREALAETDASALSFETEKVRAIELTMPQKEPLRLQKEADGWMLETPLKTRADGDKVSTLLSGLSLLRVEKKLDDVGESELSEFKLAQPSALVKLTAGDSPAEIALELGDKAPIGSEYYARKPGATQVLLVSGDVARILSTDAASLRYKKLVGLDSWKVARFQVAKGSETIAFTRGTGAEDWRLEQPISFPADATKVQGLWLDLQAAEAEAFETENATAADLRRLGLDKPALAISVQPMSDNASAPDQAAPAAPARPKVNVSMTAPDKDGKSYARRDDLPAIMKMGRETYDKLAQAVAEPSSYRDHRAAPVDRWKLSMIELHAASGAARFFKSDEDSSWHRESADGAVVPPEQANALIDAIDAVKATGFIDGADAVRSLDAARTPLAITVQEGTGESARTVSMKVLPPGASADATQRRVTSSASSSIYLVPAAAVQTLLDQSTAIARAPAPAASPAPADGPPETKQP